MKEDWICANLCNLSYKDQVDDEFVETCANIGIDLIKQVEYISCDNSECYIISLDKKIYIVLRGLDDFHDVVDDLKVYYKPLYINGIYCGHVHGGFLDYYTLIKDKVNDRINNFIEKEGINHIIFTGHSTGAVVILNAFETALYHPSLNIECLTFCAPKIGNAVFHDNFTNKVPNTTRYYIENDVVPRLPFGEYYKHIGVPVCYKDERPFSWLMIWISVFTMVFNMRLFNKYVLSGHSLLTVLDKMKSV
jgi:pimeloyl-ACP methyl ester carboxylesterase